MEDEDEHPLQGVEDGEEVRHHDGGVVEEKQAEGPGQAQQTEEDEGPRHPRPGKEQTAGERVQRTTRNQSKNLKRVLACTPGCFCGSFQDHTGGNGITSQWLLMMTVVVRCAAKGESEWEETENTAN